MTISGNSTITEFELYPEFEGGNFVIQILGSQLSQIHYDTT